MVHIIYSSTQETTPIHGISLSSTVVRSNKNRKNLHIHTIYMYIIMSSFHSHTVEQTGSFPWTPSTLIMGFSSKCKCHIYLILFNVLQLCQHFEWQFERKTIENYMIQVNWASQLMASWMTGRVSAQSVPRKAVDSIL